MLIEVELATKVDVALLDDVESVATAVVALDVVRATDDTVDVLLLLLLLEDVGSAPNPKWVLPTGAAEDDATVVVLATKVEFALVVGVTRDVDADEVIVTLLIVVVLEEIDVFENDKKLVNVPDDDTVVGGDTAVELEFVDIVLLPVEDEPRFEVEKTLLVDMLVKELVDELLLLLAVVLAEIVVSVVDVAIARVAVNDAEADVVVKV